MDNSTERAKVTYALRKLGWEGRTNFNLDESFRLWTVMPEGLYKQELFNRLKDTRMREAVYNHLRNICVSCDASPGDKLQVCSYQQAVNQETVWCNCCKGCRQKCREAYE